MMKLQDKGMGLDLISNGKKGIGVNMSDPDHAKVGWRFSRRTGEDSDDICKEVRCIEMDESNKDKIPKPWPVSTSDSESRNGNVADEEMCFETAWQSQNTPPNGFERSYPGRPERFGGMLPPLNYGAQIAGLSRNDSQSSIGSAFVDALKSQNKTSADEDIPSIDTFFAGLKEMAKLQHKKQLVDGQVQETETKAESSGKNVKNVGLDPMQDALETPQNWPVEFERQQKAILELWRTCNTSLVHRTYFFLLFKGDPTDSIYMEMVRTLTLASSTKALRRERGVLSTLMYKRFSEVERIRLYQKWGIGLDSKRRRLQLVHRLWSDTKDMNHIMESAAIVAKLIRFSEQGQALKEMFGLSFAHPPMIRRSFGWKYSMASLLVSLLYAACVMNFGADVVNEILHNIHL
ncbi:hypothetical protein F0562_020510 [Nyssa sinensis]|uniref:NPK1-activating kinesin-like protein C-terminal domain-containing protein n=1 Tax=Nyssa sinensis TaxID=561372 RepID=A0A5J5BSZ3_9ASTE|nr:hypothetical protein F0562_020510 [Nyssa sinensis]